MPRLWRMLKSDASIISQIEDFRKEVHAMNRQLVTVALSRDDHDRLHKEQETKDFIEMIQTANVSKNYMVNVVFDYRLSRGQAEVDYTLIPNDHVNTTNPEDF